jgi:hypothetical protein
MKFVLVNGRTPRPQSLYAWCCEPIGESYVRDFATALVLRSQVLPPSLRSCGASARRS